MFPNRPVFFAAAVLLTVGTTKADVAVSPPAAGAVLAQPCDFDGRLRGEEGLIVVPENRGDSASQMITVHFFRFPAREPAGLPPVFVLPGGPGDRYVAADLQVGLRQEGYNSITEIEAYHRQRDVVIVNQRGNHGVPGIHSFTAPWEAKPVKG